MKIDEKTKKIAATVFLFLFILLFLVQTYLYIKKDIGPEDTDWHIIRSAIYYKYYVLGQKKMPFQFKPPREIHHPPIVYFTTFPFFKILGMTLEAARLSLLIYSVIFLMAMFGIGYHYGGYWGGAAVMALAASSPHTLNLSRTYYQDFPQTAITALCFYLLLKTDYFRNRVITLLLGFTLALSIMTKWSSAFFLIIPVLWFYVPVFIKARGFIARIVSFLIPVGLTGALFLFFNSIDGKSSYSWFPWYLKLVIIPVVIFGILLFLYELKSRKFEDYKDSRNYSLVNFSFMSLIMFFLATPWFYWAGNTVKDKWIYEMTLQKNILFNYNIHLTFLKTVFNYAPFLVIIGIVFMMVKRDKLYEKLLLPVNIILVFLFMVKRGSPQFRYSYSLVIFMAALGGYWVVYTKKLKYYLSGLLVILSCLSIFAWTLIPVNLSYYDPIKIFDYKSPGFFPYKLLCSEAPNENRFNLAPLVDSLISSRGRPKGYYIVVNLEKESPVEFHHLSWLAFRKNEFLKSPDSWIIGVRENGMAEIVERGPDRLGKNAIVIHKSQNCPRYIIHTMLEASTREFCEIKRFDIGSGFYISHLVLKYFSDDKNEIKLDVSQKKTMTKPEKEINDAFRGIDAGDYEKMKVYLEKNPDFVNTQYRGGESLLHEASRKGYLELAKYLISKGANVMERDIESGHIPLHFAALNGHYEIAELLISNDTDINSIDMEWRVTPLHLAALNGHDKIVKLLVSKGAKIDARDKLDMTPLHLAARYGHKKAVEELLKAGAGNNIPDRLFRRVPSQWAKSNGFEEIEEMIENR